MTKDNIKLRLVLNVEFDPQGETAGQLIRNLKQVVKDAANNGTLTGNSPATVEEYGYYVEQLTIDSEAEEQQRRDEKHGLFGEHVDPAN